MILAGREALISLRVLPDINASRHLSMQQICQRVGIGKTGVSHLWNRARKQAGGGGYRRMIIYGMYGPLPFIQFFENPIGW